MVAQILRCRTNHVSTVGVPVGKESVIQETPWLRTVRSTPYLIIYLIYSLRTRTFIYLPPFLAVLTKIPLSYQIGHIRDLSNAA